MMITILLIIIKSITYIFLIEKYLNLQKFSLEKLSMHNFWCIFFSVLLNIISIFSTHQVPKQMDESAPLSPSMHAFDNENAKTDNIQVTKNDEHFSDASPVDNVGDMDDAASCNKEVFFCLYLVFHISFISGFAKSLTALCTYVFERIIERPEFR